MFLSFLDYPLYLSESCWPSFSHVFVIWFNNLTVIIYSKILSVYSRLFSISRQISWRRDFSDAFAI